MLSQQAQRLYQISQSESRTSTRSQSSLPSQHSEKLLAIRHIRASELFVLIYHQHSLSSRFKVQNESLTIDLIEQKPCRCIPACPQVPALPCSVSIPCSPAIIRAPSLRQIPLRTLHRYPIPRSKMHLYPIPSSTSRRKQLRRNPSLRTHTKSSSSP